MSLVVLLSSDFILVKTFPFSVSSIFLVLLFNFIISTPCKFSSVVEISSAEVGKFLSVLFLFFDISNPNMGDSVLNLPEDSNLVFLVTFFFNFSQFSILSGNSDLSTTSSGFLFFSIDVLFEFLLLTSKPFLVVENSFKLGEFVDTLTNVKFFFEISSPTSGEPFSVESASTVISRPTSFLSTVSGSVVAEDMCRCKFVYSVN